MTHGTLTVALISEVFFGPARDDLQRRLAEAKGLGADLAVLPELPLNPWSPASRETSEADAEPPDGPRCRAQAAAARGAGIGLVGGAIVRDPDTAQRRNTALIFDAGGALVGTYCKLHVPEEPGFWESSHYRPGTEPPATIDAFALPLGVQICSDINRPQCSHLLAAEGAAVIAVPRATEQRTYPRWRVVMRATAITAGVYVLSVNRPRPEQGVGLGGPSLAVGPDGAVLLETTDPIAIVQLDAAQVMQAREGYPASLPMRAGLYAAAWSVIAHRDQ